VTFVRRVPAPRDLGRAERIAILYTLGDNDKISSFVDTLLTQMNRDGVLRVEDATQRGQHLFAEHPDAGTMKHIRREHPADAYIGIRRFTCELRPGGGEGSMRNASGDRVKVRQVWVDAICHARIDVIDGESAARIFYFDVTGEGTSPRMTQLTDEERDIALMQAARYTAVNAAESITPRYVRESVDLDASAPRVEEASALIEANRLAETRTLWENELRHSPSSPALHFNVAVISEALGDVSAARDHYREAERLAPSEPRYRLEFERFRKRYHESLPAGR
jgi:hypothetical protein